MSDRAVQWATVEAFQGETSLGIISLTKGPVSFKGTMHLEATGHTTFRAQAGYGAIEGNHTVFYHGEAQGVLPTGQISITMVKDSIPTFTEDGPINDRYMTKQVEIKKDTETEILTHRFNFDAPDEYNQDKTVSYPLVISLHAWGFPNSEEALSIPEWTFGWLADGSPYSAMPGINQPPAFRYSPICPPPYNTKDGGGPSAPEGGEWNSPEARRMIMDTLRDLLYRFNIDRDRIYINGFSMGGAGVWYIAQEFYQEFGFPMAAICRGAGYTPTETMLDAGEFPDVSKSAVWIHVGERDNMALSWEHLGNKDLALYTYSLVKQEKGTGVETLITRNVGSGLTAVSPDDALESTLYDFSVGGKSVLRLSIYKDRNHEYLCDRNEDFVTWMFSQSN